MDKEQQLAEARKLLKKFRTKNSLKKSQNVSSSLHTPSKENSSDSSSLTQASLPGYIPVSVGNGTPEAKHVVTNSSVLNKVPAVELLQPLNSTPNQNFVASNSRTETSSLPLLNGSIADPLAPSPILVLDHPGVNFKRDTVATAASVESTPLSRTSSAEKKKLGIVENGDAKREPLNYDMPEQDSWTATEGRLKDERQRVGLGGRTGEVFSGVSQGGVLVKHMPYLPSMSPNVSPEGSSRGAESVIRRESGGRYRAGVIAARDSPGRYAVEEEIKELEQKVKVHAQTIDILVSEKSSLQLELSNCKSQLTNKSSECLNMGITLKSMERKVSKLKGEIDSFSSDLDKKSRDLEATRESKAELQKSLERLRASLDDQREEGTELVSKVTAQSAEIMRLQEANADLQSKLSMSELLLSQQQSGNKTIEAVPPVDHTLSLRLRETEGRLEQVQQDLNHVTRQRDQVNLDLSTLQEAMAQQREEGSRKLTQMQKELSEHRDQVLQLKREVDELSIDKQVLEKKLTTEQAQAEHSFQAAMETLKEERDQLAKQLESKIEENTNLVKKNTEAENSALELAIKLSRLEEHSVDHENLMKTMTQDKEALSRAMSQNKELKANNVELQEAFVKLSNQNMELATELDTERRRLAHITALQTASPPASPQTPPPSPVARQDEAMPTIPPTAVLSEDGSPSAQKVDQWVQTELEGPTHEGDPLSPSIAEMLQNIQSLEQERSQLLDQLESLRASNQHLQSELSTAQPLPVQAAIGHGWRESPVQRSEQEGREEEEEEEEEKPLTTATAGSPLAGGQGSMSPLQLAELQSSFDALQMKFVTLMREKADLLDMIEQHKLLLLTTAQQAEAMENKDVLMYQRECENLRQQFLRKDAFIEKLRAEKAQMQGNIGQLQVLMRRIIAEQKAKPQPSSPPSTAGVHSRLPPYPGSPPIGPSHSSPIVSQVPAHLRPQLSNESVLSPNESILSPDVSSESLHPHGHLDVTEPMPGLEEEEFGLSVDDSSQLTNTTAEQIIELLDRLDTAGANDQSRSSESGTVDLLMHCKVCTGQLQSV